MPEFVNWLQVLHPGDIGARFNLSGISHLLFLLHDWFAGQLVLRIGAVSKLFRILSRIQVKFGVQLLLRRELSHRFLFQLLFVLALPFPYPELLWRPACLLIVDLDLSIDSCLF